jgi:hypothetical protein
LEFTEGSLGYLEKAFVIVTVLSAVLSVQMLIHLPGHDVPDIKDIPALFPNYQ